MSWWVMLKRRSNQSGSTWLQRRLYGLANLGSAAMEAQTFRAESGG
jgi:hypothetical protein